MDVQNKMLSLLGALEKPVMQICLNKTYDPGADPDQPYFTRFWSVGNVSFKNLFEAINFVKANSTALTSAHRSRAREIQSLFSRIDYRKGKLTVHQNLQVLFTTGSFIGYPTPFYRVNSRISGFLAQAWELCRFMASVERTQYRSNISKPNRTSEPLNSAHRTLGRFAELDLHQF